MQELSKNRINFLNIVVGFSILFTFSMVVKEMFYNYAIKTNVDKAKVVTQQLLATRDYLAKIAPHTKITSSHLNAFAVSPAFVGARVSESLGKNGYIYLKQTSLNYRNPLNAPDDFETNMLRRYEKKEFSSAHYEISSMDNQEHLRYTYPLYIEKSCLACHGKPYVDVNKDTYNLLVEHYGDRSFNYKEGDLRGIVSVAISMQSIEETLKDFNIKMFVVMSILFVVILIFFYVEKRFVYDPQIFKIKQLNETLEKKVKEEVEKNRRQDQQLIQQSRLAQMGEMISMIAHQWRQPLNAISMTSSNLQLKLILGDVDKEVFKKQITKINGFSQHLSKTIDDFRNFFKNNKVKTTTNLENIVFSTLSIVEVSLENKNIEVITKLDCQYEFQVYENEVKQLILNLIKNAEDILLDNKVKNPKIKIWNTCGTNSNNPTLYIKDNGGGIPKEIIGKIFDPYFSTKSKKDGTGLGLYMSKIIIEEHCHGKLSVYNEDDGAVFKMEFNPKGDMI